MSDDRHDRVSRRAYELWEQEGGEHGRHEDHWHRAAREVEETVPAGEVEETVAAPDGTTLTVPGDEATGIAPPAAAAKPARKRASPAPAAAPAPAATPAKPRKSKAK